MSEPIFLCTQRDLIDDDASDERAVQQLSTLAGICEKLGYRLMSGVAPNLHELWAQRLDAPKPTPFKPRKVIHGFADKSSSTG